MKVIIQYVMVTLTDHIHLASNCSSQQIICNFLAAHEKTKSVLFMVSLKYGMFISYLVVFVGPIKFLQWLTASSLANTIGMIGPL